MIIKDGAKMSKSKGNVVSPDYIIKNYGADTMRLYILFIGPPHKDAEWQDTGLQGAYRFINRALRLLEILKEFKDEEVDSLNEEEKKLLKKMHFTIKEVTEDLEKNFQFNTAISKIMELVNATYKSIDSGNLRKKVLKEVIDKIFLLLAPFTPHISEEANAILGNKESIFKRSWPTYDEEFLKEEEIEMPVLINGRLRAHLKINISWSEEKIKQEALSQEKIKKYLKDKSVKKIIYVKGKIINIVC